MTRQPILSTLRPALLGTLLSAALGAPGWAQSSKPAVKPGEAVTLNFVNADIEAVARTVATLSGANVVVDPRVKGTMNLSSTTPVPPTQALRLFSAQLRTQGFALVENAGIHTVVPEADAKLQGGPVQAGQATAVGGQVLTQIFRLNHENANSLVPVLRPLISPNNTINVTPGSNALVITDYADNLQRLGRIVAALANMLTAPVYPWDAQICPSVSVQTMVQRLLDDEAAWLREHLGATRVLLPQLPVLPLGVDCDALDLPEADKARHRAHWRSRWALGEQDVCVLYMGRLDLRTKANLLPMLDALQLAAHQLKTDKGPRLHLVLAGWFASEWDETTLRAAVTQACPDVRVVFEDGRTPEARQGVWHAADLFTSLVDNIQETFGLTPIEAMAAGLPVVVSDYDGYRESVREGVDGFRIRTWQPSAGSGTDLMDRHADVILNYRDYVSRASAFIGLDIAQAAQAYVQLAQDPALRQRMGQAGRERARSTYDWARLIPQYAALFAELGRVRQSSTAQDADWTQSAGAAHANWGQRHPRRSDPFHSFAHYATQTLNGTLTLHPGPLLPTSTEGREKVLVQQIERPVYAGVKNELDTPALRQLLEKVAAQPQGLTLQTDTEAAAARHIGWLIKAGLVQVGSSQTDKP